MSQDGARHDDEVIELSLQLRGLSITIRGPASEATDFVSSIITSSATRRASSPTSTVQSFELVRSAPTSSGNFVETRDQIARSFPSCPARILADSVRLGGGKAAAEGRVRRSWLAGQWAKAVLVGRIHTPNRSEPLPLRSRYYAIARCQNVECPVIFQSANSYWRAVGTLEGSDSITHAFPSELEARTYLEAAGFETEISVQP